MHSDVSAECLSTDNHVTAHDQIPTQNPSLAYHDTTPGRQEQSGGDGR